MDSSLLFLSTSFLFLFARSVSVSHVPSASLYYRVSRRRAVLLSSLLPFPFSLSLVRPRPPSRPIMLPYCLGILSLTPKPVQIASRFARTCMSAPLSVRSSSLSPGKHPEREKGCAHPTEKNRKRCSMSHGKSKREARIGIRFANSRRETCLRVHAYI